MHDYYPKATANYWIPQLRDAPTTWTGVAKVVNKIGGDKGTQNNVISKVLGYKKRCTTTPKDRHNSDGKVTYTPRYYMNKATPEQRQAASDIYNYIVPGRK